MEKYFEKIYNYNGVTFRYAKGKSLRSGNEIHNYNEILFYVDGDAIFMSENIKEKLNRGALVIVPKECYHNFFVNDQDNYTRLVISFNELNATAEFSKIIAQKTQIINDTKGNILHTLNRMCKIIDQDRSEENKALYLYGAFLTLISDVCYGEHKEYLSINASQNNYLITRCIKFIDQNLTSSISVEKLAQAMGVSQSTLFHSFIKELGISPHKYLSEKRLILARRKIVEERLNPTSVYLDCGFNDYPSFYKAYVKMFHYSPSADKKLN